MYLNPNPRQSVMLVRPAGQTYIYNTINGQQIASIPLGVTTGREPGNPTPGQSIYGWNDAGQPLDNQGVPILPMSQPMNWTVVIVSVVIGGVAVYALTR